MDAHKIAKYRKMIQGEGSPAGRIEEEIPGGTWRDGTPKDPAERLRRLKDSVEWERFEVDSEYQEQVADVVKAIHRLEAKLPKEPPAPPVAPEGSGPAVRAAFESQAGYDPKAVTRELRLEQIEAERSRLKAEEDSLQDGALVTRIEPGGSGE